MKTHSRMLAGGGGDRGKAEWGWELSPTEQQKAFIIEQRI